MSCTIPKWKRRAIVFSYLRLCFIRCNLLMICDFFNSGQLPMACWPSGTGTSTLMWVNYRFNPLVSSPRGKKVVKSSLAIPTNLYPSLKILAGTNIPSLQRDQFSLLKSCLHHFYAGSAQFYFLVVYIFDKPDWHAIRIIVERPKGINR